MAVCDMDMCWVMVEASVVGASAFTEPRDCTSKDHKSTKYLGRHDTIHLLDS